jgi:hypothetical protein
MREVLGMRFPFFSRRATRIGIEPRRDQSLSYGWLERDVERSSSDEQEARDDVALRLTLGAEALFGRARRRWKR